MNRLEGKVALITGAGSGIGRACMIMFAHEGAKVFGISRTQSKLDDTLELVTTAGDEGTVTSADLSVPEQVEEAVNKCIETYGTIDILLNIAGVGYNLRETSIGSMDPIDTTPIDKWHEVIALNLNSVFYVSRLVIPLMKQQQRGSIVNVASIFGMCGAPDAHTYTATKGAIINLSRSIAVAYADDNIRCNVVAPGFVATPMVESVLGQLFTPENAKLMTPLARPATPEEISYACLYLASDEASYCTGAVLPVDGGSTARA